MQTLEYNYGLAGSALLIRRQFSRVTPSFLQNTVRLYPLTEESNMPKALLPVGNQPMISYQLAWLEDSGVTGQ
jgi:hypothetical protein